MTTLSEAPTKTQGRFAVPFRSAQHLQMHLQDFFFSFQSLPAAIDGVAFGGHQLCTIGAGFRPKISYNIVCASESCQKMVLFALAPSFFLVVVVVHTLNTPLCWRLTLVTVRSGQTVSRCDVLRAFLLFLGNGLVVVVRGARALFVNRMLWEGNKAGNVLWSGV